MMRICRLNSIKIKDPAKWDTAKYEDFVANRYVQADRKRKNLNTFQPEEQEMLTINEEVTIFEYAPKKF